MIHDQGDILNSDISKCNIQLQMLLLKRPRVFCLFTSSRSPWVLVLVLVVSPTGLEPALEPVVAQSVVLEPEVEPQLLWLYHFFERCRSWSLGQNLFYISRPIPSGKVHVGHLTKLWIISVLLGLINRPLVIRIPVICRPYMQILIFQIFDTTITYVLLCSERNPH